MQVSVLAGSLEKAGRRVSYYTYTLAFAKPTRRTVSLNSCPFAEFKKSPWLEMPPYML